MLKKDIKDFLVYSIGEPVTRIIIRTPTSDSSRGG